MRKKAAQESSEHKKGHTVCCESTSNTNTSVTDKHEWVRHQLKWPLGNNVATFQPRWFLYASEEKEFLQSLLFTTPWQNAPTKDDGVNFSVGDFNSWVNLEVVLQITQLRYLAASQKRTRSKTKRPGHLDTHSGAVLHKLKSQSYSE